MSIESLRGLAVILMVAGHVIGATADRGMQVSDGSAWRLFYQGLEDIRMPLFTVLSGFVYAYRPLTSVDGIPGMVKGKARRLLVPMMTVGTLFFFLQLFVPGTNAKPELSEFWRIFFFSFAHLWFVQAIFLIFLVVGALNAFKLLETRKQLAIALVAAGVLFVLVPSGLNLFSVGGAARLLPFFLLGYGLKRFAGALRTSSVVSLVIAFALVFAARLWVLLGEVELANPVLKTLTLAVGVLSVSLLVIARDRIQLRFLARLGPFAFGIYLLHVFGSAGARLALGKVGIESDIAVFVGCMVLAVGLPVLFERMLGRFSLISWGILGQKPSNRVAAPELEAATR